MATSATIMRAGDVGVPITLSIGGTSDLAGATATIKFQLPSGTTIARPATVSGRNITYTTVIGDFTAAGTVIVQGYVVLAGGQGRHTGRAEFQVEATL